MEAGLKTLLCGEVASPLPHPPDLQTSPSFPVWGTLLGLRQGEQELHPHDPRGQRWAPVCLGLPHPRAGLPGRILAKMAPSRRHSNPGAGHGTVRGSELELVVTGSC